MVVKNKVINKMRDKKLNSIVSKNRFWIYLISLIFPLIGFVFALGYAHGVENEERRFGKKCFILGMLGVFIYILFIIAWAMYIFFKS